jgi:hypothetical protein
VERFRAGRFYGTLAANRTLFERAVMLGGNRFDPAEILTPAQGIF